MAEEKEMEKEESGNTSSTETMTMKDSSDTDATDAGTVASLPVNLTQTSSSEAFPTGKIGGEWQAS